MLIINDFFVFFKCFCFWFVRVCLLFYCTCFFCESFCIILFCRSKKKTKKQKNKNKNFKHTPKKHCHNNEGVLSSIAEYFDFYRKESMFYPSCCMSLCFCVCWFLVLARCVFYFVVCSLLVFRVCLLVSKIKQ